MGFYYISFLSIVPLGIAYGLLALVYWGVARGTRALPGRKAILSVLGVIFLFLPVAEELWIAWNFGQACKEAGTYISRKVEVDGYYDDTGVTTRIVGGPAYRFIESRDRDGKFHRVERASAEEKAKALAWWVEKNPQKQMEAKKWITQPINDRVRVTVEMDTGYAWRISELERPMARYHYKIPNPYGARVAYKVGKSEEVVIDTETQEKIARYTGFGRRPPWFYIGLGAPAFACHAPGRWPFRGDSPLVYRKVLIPAARR